MTIRRLDLRAHRPERLGDPLHRPRAERFVADELEAALLPGQDSGEEPHQRARVAAVERACGLCDSTRADALDANPVAVHLHPTSERAYGGSRRERVLGGPEPVHVALAVGNRSEQERAVGDRLVAGDCEIAVKRRRGLDAHQRPFRWRCRRSAACVAWRGT